MSVSDPIADFLTCIRNSLHAKKRHVDIPSSNMKRAIAEVLHKTQRPIPLTARAKEVHVGRFPILVERKYDARAAAKETLRAREKICVQRAECRRHRPVAGTRSLRH